MRWKNVALAVTALMLLGLFAAPASADKVKDKDGAPGGLKDTGTVAGDATVGKLRTGCAHDGTSRVFGSGIGLPFQTKNAYWEIGNRAPASVTSLTSISPPLKNGRLRACGRLTAMLSEAGGGLGAACGSSKGWDGKGTVSFPGTTKTTIWLKNLGWKASVTTFIVTGTANQDATEEASKDKEPEDIIVAVIQAQGAGPCTTKGPVPVVNPTPKTNDNNQGAREFAVAGTYTIANGEYKDPNSLPGTCKSGVENRCLYDRKKTGKSG